MRTLIALLVVLDIVFTGTIVFLLLEARAQDNVMLMELQGAEHNAAEEAVYNAVIDPVGYFDILKTYPSWEKIEAIPYSDCYRHLVSTSTADYIFCQAI